MQNQNWVPPPPPNDGSRFSGNTRDYYAQDIGKKATQALIFGLIGMFCCGIFAIFGLNAANDALTNIATYDVAHDKKGIAMTGKVLSIIGLVLWGLSIIIRVGMAIAGKSF